MESKNIFFHPPKPALIALVTFLGIFSLLGVFKIVNESKRASHTLSVTGTGRVAAQPDIALFNINVSLQSYNISDVQSQNTAVTNAIINFLKDQEVEEKDVQTKSYTIYPWWDYTDKGRKFRGFQIHHVLAVKVRDFEKIGTILESVIGLGANDVHFNFGFEEREKLEAKARAEAIDQAKKKAGELARQLGVHLVRVVSFSDQGAPLGRLGEGMFDAEAAKAEAPTGPTVAAGESEIQSTVTIVYEMN